MARRRFLSLIGLGGSIGFLGMTQGPQGPPGPPGGTHDILSATHLDSLPAAVVAGDLVHGNATPKWARLPKGIDGDLLRLISGLPSWGNKMISSLVWTMDQSPVDVFRFTNVAETVLYGAFTKFNTGGFIGNGPGIAISSPTEIIVDAASRVFAAGSAAEFGTSTAPFGAGYVDNLRITSLFHRAPVGSIALNRRFKFVSGALGIDATTTEGDLGFDFTTTHRPRFGNGTAVRAIAAMDDLHNEDHKARHVSGGADPFASTDLIEAIVKRLQESAGPTALLMGAVADGEFLKRSGTSIVGRASREDLVAHWDQSQTKTNIGTAFVDVYTQTNADGKSARVDFAGKTQFAARILWNKIGAGTHNVRCVDRDDLANVLFDVAVVSGPNVVAPAALPGWATGVKNLKLQAKSTTGADDPVFEGCNLNLVG